MLTVTKRSFTRTLKSRRIVPSMKSSRMWPPSSGGIGSRFKTARLTPIMAISESSSEIPCARRAPGFTRDSQRPLELLQRNVAAEKLDDHVQNLPPHERVHSDRFDNRRAEGETPVHQFSSSQNPDLPSRRPGPGTHLLRTNLDMQCPIATLNLEVERLRLRLIYYRGKFRAIGQRNAVDLQNYVTRLQSAALRRRSRTNSTDHEVIGWISEDVFHGSAGGNRNRKFLAVAVNHEGKRMAGQGRHQLRVARDPTWDCWHR